MYYFAVNSKLL